MLVSGRLSSRTVSPCAKLAVSGPPLATRKFHVQLLPSGTEPPASLDLVTVKSGAVTTTVLLQSLFDSSVSSETLLGSTAHWSVRALGGLAKVPAAVGVAVNETSNESDAGKLKPPVPAVHVKSL